MARIFERMQIGEQRVDAQRLILSSAAKDIARRVLGDGLEKKGSGRGVPKPYLGVVLGTGMGGLVDRLDLCPNSAEGATINSLGCADDITAIVLKGVTFKSGTATLTESAQKSLITIAEILKASAPNQQFEIAGYTDSIGDPALNQQVSEQRAKAVRIFLIKQGVQANLLIPKGYGFANPIADNATPEGRARNRRVELHKLP